MARRQIPCTVKRRRGLLIAVPARKNREPKRRTSPKVWLLGKEAPVGPPWTDTSSGDGRGRPTRSFTTADMGTSRAARESQAASLGRRVMTKATTRAAQRRPSQGNPPRLLARETSLSQKGLSSPCRRWASPSSPGKTATTEAARERPRALKSPTPQRSQNVLSVPPLTEDRKSTR